jgi:hypothetical protein
MKLDNFLKSVSTLEIILFIIFVVYLVFQIPTPRFLIPVIDSPLGLGIVVVTTIYVFFYTTPILAILSVLVAYELLRRSSVISSIEYPIAPYLPTQHKKDVIIKQMNPVKKVTLEEEVIQVMAPLGTNDPATFIETSYQTLPDKKLDNVATV